jgi:putative phage-type endonuclease
MTAIELLPATKAVPTNPLWHDLRSHGVTASEISAILGISPWDSPFSLYWRKTMGWQTDDAEHLEAGRRAEGMIADWFADRADPHGNLVVEPAGLYAHPDRPWQLATPDRLVYLDLALAPVCCDHTPCICAEEQPPVAVLECKHPYSWDGFGDDGTDIIPVYYRAQLLWQIDVLGVDEGYLAAYAQHELRTYRLRRDEADLRVMRAAGRQFMDRLEAGDPPEIDSHAATGAALKRLHPTVQDVDVEVPVDLAEGYRRARALRARAESLVDGFEHRIRAAIGDGRRAMCGGRLVASRSVYDQGTDQAELTALEDDWPTTNRLNPGRAASYA